MKVHGIGRLGRDPEMRYTTEGKAVTSFSVAFEEGYGDRKHTCWLKCNAFGKQAEIIAKYCGKGSGILVEGRLKLDQWEDKKTGEKRSRLGVVLENFTFIGGKSQGGEEGGSAPRSRGGNDTPAPSGDHGGDDVPF
jgi:single-strand DNA-binding protein